MRFILSILVLWSYACGLLATGPGATEGDIETVINIVGSRSERDIPPIGNGENPVSIGVNLNLVSVRDVDISRNEVEVTAWLMMTWDDPRLAWAGPNYQFMVQFEGRHQENVSALPMPAQYLWTPDITLYNVAMAPELLTPDLAVISQNGHVTLIPSYRFRFTCDLSDVESSHGTNCTMKFGSWVYNGFKLDLEDNPRLDISGFQENPAYEVTAPSASKNVMMYQCCDEPYVDVTFSFNIKKRAAGRGWFS